jgi:hypothetical protein
LAGSPLHLILAEIGYQEMIIEKYCLRRHLLSLSYKLLAGD